MIDDILDEIDNHINAIDELISQAQGRCLLKDLSMFDNLRKELLAFRGSMMSTWGILKEGE